MKWFKFLQLTRADKRLFLKVAQLLVATRIGLTLLPYKTILHIFDRLSERSDERPAFTEDDYRYAEQVVFLTRAGGRRILGSRPCLPQALVVECLLKRRGFDASLHIGVTKDANDELLAHAWVENEGAIVIGGRLSSRRYSRIRPLKPDTS